MMRVMFYSLLGSVDGLALASGSRAPWEAISAGRETLGVRLSWVKINSWFLPIIC